MRYELSDYEWSVIRPMLPNKPRGIPRVDDRRILNGIFWVLRQAHHGAICQTATVPLRLATIASFSGQLMGRSRGGLTSKIHVVVDGNGLPVQLGLTGGQAHDNRLCSVLLRYLPRRARLLADRGYDADWIRAFVTERGAWANIPPKRNRKDPNLARQRIVQRAASGVLP